MGTSMVFVSQINEKYAKCVMECSEDFRTVAGPKKNTKFSLHDGKYSTVFIRQMGTVFLCDNALIDSCTFYFMIHHIHSN